MSEGDWTKRYRRAIDWRNLWIGFGLAALMIGAVVRAWFDG